MASKGNGHSKTALEAITSRSNVAATRNKTGHNNGHNKIERDKSLVKGKRHSKTARGKGRNKTGRQITSRSSNVAATNKTGHSNARHKIRKGKNPVMHKCRNKIAKVNDRNKTGSNGRHKTGMGKALSKAVTEMHLTQKEKGSNARLSSVTSKPGHRKTGVIKIIQIPTNRLAATKKKITK